MALQLVHILSRVTAGGNRLERHDRTTTSWSRIDFTENSAHPRFTVTGADPAQFHNPTFKRHNPKTVRWNTGDEYHGCLRIDVQQSADLYRRIEGWARAALGVTEAEVTTP